MKGFELLSLLLAVVVPFGVVNGFRAERPNVDEQPNLVRLVGCSSNDQIEYNDNPIASNPFTVNRSNAGVYQCLSNGDSVTVIPIPESTNNVTRAAAWGQLLTLDCGFKPGNYRVGYSVTWLIRSSNSTETRLCRPGDTADICSNFNINATDFSISFQYYPTRNHFSCQVTNNADPSRPSKSPILTAYTLYPSTNNSVNSRFLSAPRPLMIDSTTSQASFSVSAAVQNDTPITIKAFASEVVITADCNTNPSDPLTLRMCNKILGNVNTDITCNYSQPYHIDCNVTMNLSSINKNTRNVYPITFLLGTKDSHQTGMISKGTSNNPLPTPIISLSTNGDSLDNISIVLPFSIPEVTHSSLKLKLCFNNSRNISLDHSNFTISDNIINVMTGMDSFSPGAYEVTYSLSFFGETPEMSPAETFDIKTIYITSNLVVSTTLIPIPTKDDVVSITYLPSSNSPLISSSNPVSTATSVPSVLIVSLSNAAATLTIIMILILIFVGIYVTKRKRNAITHQDNDDINLQHLSVSRGTATHCNIKLNEAYGSAATTNVVYESIEEIEPEGLLHERGLQANVAYGSATGPTTTIHTNVAYDSIEGIEPRPEGLLQANVAYGSATGTATTIHTNVAYDSIEGIEPRPEGLQHERRLQANEAYDSTTGIGTLC